GPEGPATRPPICVWCRLAGGNRNKRTSRRLRREVASRLAERFRYRSRKKTKAGTIRVRALDRRGHICGVRRRPQSTARRALFREPPPKPAKMIGAARVR